MRKTTVMSNVVRHLLIQHTAAIKEMWLRRANGSHYVRHGDEL